MSGAHLSFWSAYVLVAAGIGISMVLPILRGLIPGPPALVAPGPWRPYAAVAAVSLLTAVLVVALNDGSFEPYAALLAVTPGIPRCRKWQAAEHPAATGWPGRPRGRRVRHPLSRRLTRYDGTGCAPAGGSPHVPMSQAQAPTRRISRMRLHHSSTQPKSQGARAPCRVQLRQPCGGGLRRIAAGTPAPVVRGYSEAIEDSSIDAVVVAVPPKFHLSYLQALAAGKHVRSKAGLPPHGRTTRPRSAPGMRRAAWSSSARTSLQATGRHPPPAGRGRRQREMVSLISRRLRRS